MLIYFAKGKLPWQGLHKKKDKKDLFERISDVKLSTSLNVLCNGLHPCFLKYMEYCRRIQFDETPDYKYLKNLLLETIKENNYVCNYEWI